MDQSAQQIFSHMLGLSRLSMQYGQTFRFTTYPDGETRESDTDHSFMLGICACAIRDLCAPELDRGKLAEYALVHDLVEVYAGDTATLGNFDKSEKQAREHQALIRLQQEWDQSFPWITECIIRYEKQEEPEARFIKVLGKIMPSLTHLHNNGEIFDRLGVSPEDIKIGKERQEEFIRTTAKEWPLLIELYETALEKTFQLPYFTQK